MTVHIKTEAALLLLGLTGHGSRCFLNALPHHVHDKRISCGRRPYMFQLEHIQRVANVMAAAELGVQQAVRVVLAQIEGRM